MTGKVLFSYIADIHVALTEIKKAGWDVTNGPLPGSIRIAKPGKNPIATITTNVCEIDPTKALEVLHDPN